MNKQQQLGSDSASDSQKQKRSVTGFQIFKNKNFNQIREENPHQETDLIVSYLQSMWNNQLTHEQREEFNQQAQQLQTTHQLAVKQTFD